MNENDLPYRAEYAKSGRASCKACKTPIDKDELRLAVLVQSAFHDGKQPNWYHEGCFFIKQRPPTEGDIAHFESLRYEDQKRLREKIAKMTGGVVEAVPKGKGKSKKRAADQGIALKDYGVEYAASGRAVCRGCEIKILKDEIRVKKLAYDTEVAMKYGPQPLWHHLDCFAKIRNELGYFETGEALPGYKLLTKEDQQKVKDALPVMKATDDVPVKKLKGEPKDEVDAAKDKKDEKIIAAQQKALYKIRDALKDGNITKNMMVDILSRNSQTIPEGCGYDETLERVCDIITFGSLKPCTECSGQLVFKKAAYICEGDLTEWVKCEKSYPKPERIPTKIPSGLKKQFKFFEKYKSQVMDRVIKYVPPSVSTISKTIKKNDENAEPRVKREKPPLYNMEFVLLGNTKTPKDELKARIIKMGGKVTTRLSEKVAAVISTPDEVEKMNKRMQEIKELEIQVVPEDFLDDVKNGGAFSFITSRAICDWGSDPHTRIPTDEELKSAKSKSFYTKSVPSTVKLQLKGGLAVDPASGLEHKAHVYREGKEIFNSVLNLVDIQSGKNSYYKLQLLQSDKDSNRFWVFRGWGRIGTTIGDKRVDDFYTSLDAIDAFKQHYADKTGNEWEFRNRFVKRPGKYYPVDIDYSDEKVKTLSEDSNVKSELKKPIQELIRMLFDVDTMKKTMLEFELDMEKMPLGKLSQKQLQAAYKVLSELQELVQSGGTNARFIDASNRFYSLIPHNFGIEKPTILDTVELIKSKSEMIDNLLEIEVAYSLLNAATDDSKHPIDSHYEQLKTDMEVLKRDTDEFKILETYVRNTHAETHNEYSLCIEEIFKIRRKGEDRRYKPFKKLHNRKLLWHGSRLTNFVGILTHGLKIAPPEAPATGYMFGKGIYFADMVSKSANYCATTRSSRTGLMLLCEVALGEMEHLHAAKYVTKLPNDKHSVIGVGRTHPHPDERHIREDGVEIPYGKGVENPNIKSSLLYNEYIVYDVAQVNVQYLFKMRFDYKY
uniref:Poly [ADP-ribose] polymerase n=1 Tax=Corethrella appendiculata TaxID=1370023 RepID=U5EZI1_9DIPT